MNDPHTHVADRAYVGATRRAKPRLGERASRNASEPDSASKRYSQVASLPKVVKPETGGEAAGVCSRRACRGGWGRRASKGWPRNLGDPSGWVEPNGRREDISAVRGPPGVGGAHSSEEAG